MNPYTWRAAILKSNLMPTTRHVLLTISCYLNELGQNAFPSTKMLSKDTGLSERAVITHIQKAVGSGWLKIKKHKNGGHDWALHQYYPATPIGYFDTEGAGYPSTQDDNYDDEGTERRSAPETENTENALNVVHEGTEPPSEGTERRSKGTEPNDTKALNLTTEALNVVPKALNDVQSNYPIYITNEVNNKNKREQVAPKFDPLVELINLGVVEQTATDWMQHRKDKRGSTSRSVINDRIKEASLAGLTLDEALTEEMSRSWQGFKAEWVKRNQGGKPSSSGNRDRSAAAAAVFGFDVVDDSEEFIDVN